MKPLEGKVALVTGATRQVGQGVAIGLAEAGALVYITGRHLNEKKPPGKGKPNPFWGSLRNTEKAIKAVGGTVIPICCDHRKDEQTQVVFEQIEKEQGRLDILVNSAWGGYERMRGAYPEDGPFDFQGNFWEQPLSLWDEMQVVGVRSNYIAGALAARMMVRQQQGLIVSISFVSGRKYLSNVAYGVSHAAIDRMAQDMAIELQPFRVASVVLYPMGDVQDKRWGGPECESPVFVGRAVAALAGDEKVFDRSGQILLTRALAKEYGFTDTDGSQPEIPAKWGAFLE